MKEKTETIVIFCAMIFMYLLGVLNGIVVLQPCEESPGRLPSYNLQDRDWQPDTYWDLWFYNFSFSDNSYIVHIEPELEYPQSIMLDIRYEARDMEHLLTKPDPSLMVHNAIVTPLRTKVYDGTLRTVWLVSGLEPGEYYNFQFMGKGVCGRFRE